MRQQHKSVQFSCKMPAGAASKLLGSNASLLTAEQLALVDVLAENGQEHLFSKWPARGVNDAEKTELAEQIVHINGASATHTR